MKFRDNELEKIKEFVKDLFELEDGIWITEKDMELEDCKELMMEDGLNKFVRFTKEFDIK